MKAKFGDVVRLPGKDDLMTVSSVEERTPPFENYVWCVWFDEKEKLRKLRFYQSDLIVVAFGLFYAG